MRSKEKKFNLKRGVRNMSLIDEIKEISRSHDVVLDEEDIIGSFRNHANFTNIGRCEVLSEDFIREYKHCLNMYMVSITQTLSEEFIIEHMSSLNAYYISVHQHCIQISSFIKRTY